MIVDCSKCTRRKHCFVKEFTVLSCEDYREEETEKSEETENDGR